MLANKKNLVCWSCGEKPGNCDKCSKRFFYSDKRFFDFDKVVDRFVYGTFIILLLVSFSRLVFFVGRVLYNDFVVFGFENALNGLSFLVSFFVLAYMIGYALERKQ